MQYAVFVSSEVHGVFTGVTVLSSQFRGDIFGLHQKCVCLDFFFKVFFLMRSKLSGEIQLLDLCSSQRQLIGWCIFACVFVVCLFV